MSIISGIKNILHKVIETDKKVEKTQQAIAKATVYAVKEEIQEIKDLNLTEVDKTQGDIVADVAITAMASMGIPASATMKQIISTSAAYTIRDIKEGCTNPNKLIVMRVVNKVRELIAQSNS